MRQRLRREKSCAPSVPPWNRSWLSQSDRNQHLTERAHTDQHHLEGCDACSTSEEIAFTHPLGACEFAPPHLASCSECAWSAMRAAAAPKRTLKLLHDALNHPRVFRRGPSGPMTEVSLRMNRLGSRCAPITFTARHENAALRNFNPAGDRFGSKA